MNTVLEPMFFPSISFLVGFWFMYHV